MPAFGAYTGGLSIRDKAFRGATLGGAELEVRGDRLIILRDSGALSGRAGGGGPMRPMALPASKETVWDGRLALTASAPGVMVYADGSKARIEAPRGASVATHWLLADRVAHLLAGAKLSDAPQNAANEINIPKP